MAEITRTVDYVNPNPREWKTDDGKTMYFVEAIFDDGSAGSALCWSLASVDEHTAALKALVGIEVEFGIKDKIREFNGQKQYSLTSFPGKPAGGGGGGGKSSGGMSHSQAGVMAAASALGPSFAKDQITEPKVIAAMVIEVGEILTEHLFSRRKDDGAPAESSAPTPESHTSAAPPVAPANAITLPQMKRLKELGASRGLETADQIAEFLSIDSLGKLSSEDAELVIEQWA